MFVSAKKQNKEEHLLEQVFSQITVMECHKINY